MQRKEISNSGHYATNERESGRTTAKDGQKGYSSKSGKASSQRRRGNERANGAKKRQEGTRLLVFKLADFLTDEEIKRLKAIK